MVTGVRELRTLVSIDSHWAVTYVVVNACAVWAINWDVFVVGSKSMSVSVGVVQKSSLEHLIIGRFNSWNEMRG